MCGCVGEWVGAHQGGKLRACARRHTVKRVWTHRRSLTECTDTETRIHTDIDTNTDTDTDTDINTDIFIFVNIHILAKRTKRHEG